VKTDTNQTLRQAGRERGSTFILVLAVLSILVLIAATLSYTARLEEVSAANYAEGIQARMAAQTGISAFFAALEPAGSTVTLSGAMALAPAYGAAPMQRPLYAGMGSMAPAAMPRGPDVPYRPGASPGFVLETRQQIECNETAVATPLTQTRVVDESSKINVNALGSWAEFRTAALPALQGPSMRADSGATTDPLAPGPRVALADALYAVFSSPETHAPAVSRDVTHELARRILAYRYGPDGQPGRAGFDDDGDGPGGLARPGMWSPLGGRSYTYQGGGLQADTTSSAMPYDGRLPADTEHDSFDNDGDGLADEPGEGVDEPDEFVADPRLPPNGDDRPFRRIEDLLEVDGMTVAMFLALRPYVTVFSASERRIGPERLAEAQMDLNAAPIGLVYEQLRKHFPAVPPEASAQFAANIVDFRDADSAPSLVHVQGTAHPILGMEVTPCITEVWPDSLTDEREGDDGQYVEISNPYDMPLPLDGWSVQVRGGAPTTLQGTLPPGGFLIVTDDYNGRNDNRGGPKKYGRHGSFYDIFGVVPNPPRRLMVENGGFDLPNEGGEVELRDGSGNLIDLFIYDGRAVGGTLTKSLQRANPRVRQADLARCTPFGLSSQGDAQPIPLATAQSIRNRPFQSSLDLFTIGSAWTSAQGQSQVATNALETPTIGNRRPDAFNERLADLFTVWNDSERAEALLADKMGVEPPRELAGAPGSTGSQPGERFGIFSRIAMADVQVPSSLTECGRININTAPAPVLRALPGITGAQIQQIMTRRVAGIARDAAGMPAAYGQWSDLLGDEAFWQGAPQGLRLATAAQWMRSITFDSKSYLLFCENRSEPPSGPRLSTRAKIEALVAVDGGRNRVVSWRFVE